MFVIRWSRGWLGAPAGKKNGGVGTREHVGRPSVGHGRRVIRPAERVRAVMETAVSNVTAPSPPPCRYAPGLGVQAGVTISYTVGIFGNLLALLILHRTRSSSNQKHGFMLRCLATNDCIALTGMLVQMYVSLFWPDTTKSVWSCRFRVLWRFFGLGSGCVAIIMAVERWLALTKPFFYQKVSDPDTNLNP